MVFAVGKGQEEWAGSVTDVRIVPGCLVLGSLTRCCPVPWM